MKNKISLTLLAAAVLALSGCAGGGAYQAKNTTKYDLENHDVFALMDSRVQRSITSSGIQQGVTSDGRLEVVANIRNRESRRLQVQVSCVFKDAQGFSTGDETPWQNLILTENSQESVRFTAMNDKAKRYTVRVREAH
ncbi:MAG: YcfL family protein [Verrucomicrobiota bacterium]